MGFSIIDDQVKLLSSDPVQTADAVLDGQVLLLISGGGGAEKAVVEPRQNVALRVVQDLFLHLWGQACGRIGHCRFFSELLLFS